MKKRILMCAESSHIVSGFGNYTKNILQRLHNTGKYEIAELSCYRDPDVPKTEPWKVYPCAVKTNHPLYEKFASNEANQFGQWLFDFVLLDFKPHIVFDIRDFWNFLYQETSSLREFYHWIIAPTYDSAPQKIDIINSFYNADMVCFHTDWARENLTTKYNYKQSNLGPTVSDSVDHKIFKPIGYSKGFHKIKHGIDSDTFIIGSVMRNQKRKLIPDILETFAKVCKSNPCKKIKLYLHTSYPDGLAWDLPSLLLEYNIANKVLLSYKCTKCGKYFPNVFIGTKAPCKFCKDRTAIIASVKRGVSESELNDIYNLFDVYVQYAICEGFGIPVVEAASCGLPIITINNEAMGEVGRNVGASLVEIQRSFREQETNAIRAYPDNQQLYDILNEYINMSNKSINSIGKISRKKCLDHYSWDKTAAIFEKIFDNIDISKKISWDSEIRQTNPKYVVNSKSSHREVIYDIVDNVIAEPFLKNTNFIEELIKSANDEYVQHGQKSISFTPKNYISILEGYMNNKVALEKLRTESMNMLSKDIKKLLDYSKK